MKNTSILKKLTQIGLIIAAVGLTLPLQAGRGGNGGGGAGGGNGGVCPEGYTPGSRTLQGTRQVDGRGTGKQSRAGKADGTGGGQQSGQRKGGGLGDGSGPLRDGSGGNCPTPGE